MLRHRTIRRRVVRFFPKQTDHRAPTHDLWTSALVQPRPSHLLTDCQLSYSAAVEAQGADCTISNRREPLANIVSSAGHFRNLAEQRTVATLIEFNVPARDAATRGPGFREHVGTVLATVKGCTSGADAPPLTVACAPCCATRYGRDEKTVSGRTKKLRGAGRGSYRMTD